MIINGVNAAKSKEELQEKIMKVCYPESELNSKNHTLALNTLQDFL
jgi:hypothetical protein